MKKDVRMLLSICMLLCLMLVPSALANDITILNDGSILSNQDLSFQTCVEGNSIKHSLYCVDDGQSMSVPAIQFTDTCVASSVDLLDFQCSEIDISATYLQDGVSKKVTKTVLTKKTLSDPQTILEKQEWDGGWGTPSDTGYAIWILSRYSPEYDKQITEGLEWLKLQRKESEKCWTSINGQCNLYQTARTLAFLEFAGFNFTEKIYQDGVNYLESQLNYIEDSDWTVEVLPLDDGNCTVRYGTSTLYDDDVIEDEKLSFSITAAHGTLINVTCPDMAEKVTLLNSEGRNIFYHEYEKNTDDYFDYTIVEDDDEYTIGDNSLFRIPPACWSSSEKWDYCHRQTTLYASLLPEIDSDKRDEARDWLEDELRSGDIIGKFLSTSNSIVDTGLYLYAFDPDNEDVLAWLIHKQNNDGSWGEGSTETIVKSTAYALLALRNQTFSGSEDVISDGVKWLSGQHPNQGWETFEQDAISFIILRDTDEKRLKSNPTPVKVSESKKVTLSNPTGFDLQNITGYFTNGLGDVLSASSVKEIASLDSKDITLTSKAKTAGFYAGTYVLQSNGTKVLEIPIGLEEELYFDVSLKTDTVYFFSDIQNVEFVIKTNGDFSCDLSWNTANISSTNSFSASGSTSKVIPVTTTRFENTEVSGMLSCDSQMDSPGVSSYEIPINFELKYYDTVPFDVSPEKVKLKGTNNGTIKIENNLDDDFVVSLAFVREPAYLTLAKRSIEVPAKDSVEVNVLNLATPIANFTTEENAIVEVKGLGETQLVDVELTVPPLGEEGGSWLLIILVVLILAGAGGGYYYYETQQKNTQKEKKSKFDYKKKFLEFKSDLREVLPESLQKYIPKSKAEIDAEKAEFRKTLQKTHLKDMVVVMKKMEKTDLEIKKKLLHEGMTEDEIEKLINIVTLEEEIDDSIKQEEQTLGIIEEISENASAKESLQKKGYTPEMIKKALEELKHDVTEKEDLLKKQSGKDKEE